MHTQARGRTHTTTAILHPSAAVASAASVAVNVCALSQKERTVVAGCVPKSPNDHNVRSLTLHSFSRMRVRSLSLSLSVSCSRCLRLWLFEFLISLARDGTCASGGRRGWRRRRTNGRANNVDETGLKRKTRWKKKKLETQLWVRSSSNSSSRSRSRRHSRRRRSLCRGWLSLVESCCNCKGNRRQSTWVGRPALGPGWGWAASPLVFPSVRLSVCVYVCACGLAWLLRQLEKHVETWASDATQALHRNLNCCLLEWVCVCVSVSVRAGALVCRRCRRWQRCLRASVGGIT